MAKLPPSLSLQAIPIRSALSEGRTEDAKRMIVDLLRAGKADRVVQGLAVDFVKPPKRGRGRQKTLPQFWYEIGEVFHEMRDAGTSYGEAITTLADRFGFSETHIRNAIGVYDSAKDEHDQEARK